jgi:hypothetical protein
MNDPDSGTSPTTLRRILEAIETRIYELNERNHPFPRRAFTGVWTLPKHRNAGFSQAAVKRTGQFTDEEGVIDYVTVPLDNLPSLRGAQWAGWEPLRKNERFHLLRRPLPRRRFVRLR